MNDQKAELKAAFIYFLKIFAFTDTTVWTSLHICSGFHSQGEPLTCMQWTLRLISGTAPANPLVAPMATEPFDLHTYTCMQALVGLKPGSRGPHGALHARYVSFLFSALVSYLEEIVGVVMPPNQRWYCILQVFFNYFSFLCSGYVLIAMTFECF